MAFGKSGVPATSPTRWSSVLRQIQRILAKGLTELNAVCRDDNHHECVFTQKEWDQLNELSVILDPFRLYTDMLQGEEVRRGCR